MVRLPKSISGGILRDVAIIFLSILIAIILAKTDILIRILVSARELELLGSFVAGMFFTSVFTTAPSTVTLGELARNNSVFLVALFGGLGAMADDWIIFRFVRDSLSEHIPKLIRLPAGGRRLRLIFKTKLFRWLAFLVGGLIIASPLPDEIGIALWSFSRLGGWRMAATSFVFNTVGILFIGLVAKSL